eukprot:NODE_13071_length_1187_cov_3.473585.p2 GENE.NODE_13071_length_1187_cov_3.473585~~NODE_13071_length_1187_cov_3.473585.p2  ORF type:complete len:307 (+),score=99.67 NODE_13071_length_1187_cov_3.473585:118-921(+)
MSQELNQQMFETLLEDPAVQNAVKKAGEDALNNPAVQEAILKKCQEKFPGVADKAKGKIKTMAADPDNQEKAYKCAGMAVVYAKGAKREFVSHLEQGPAGVRVLACLGGLAACGLAGFNLVNVFGILTHTLSYISNIYQVIFSLSVIIFEAPDEWVEKASEKAPFILSYHDTLEDNAKFLTQVGGRGLMYIFLGTLWIGSAGISSITGLCALGLGFYLALIGAFHVLMHFNILPKQVLDKVRGRGGGPTTRSVKTGHQRLTLREEEE